MMVHELEVLNREGELKTYEDSRGKSANIDVTMVTRAMVRHVRGWRVRCDWKGYWMLGHKSDRGKGRRREGWKRIWRKRRCNARKAD